MSFELTSMDSLRRDVGIIDDSNYGKYVRLIEDPNEPFSGGYEDPGFDVGLGSCSSEWNGTIISEKDAEELIRLHDANQSSPDHWRLHGNSAILDQNGFPYCWMFGPVGAMQTALAQTGMPNVPKLCATATAARVKNWRKVGGWGDQAVEGIQKWGVPGNDVWDQKDIGSPAKWQQEAVIRSAAMNNIVEFIKLPLVRGQVPEEVLRSVLLDPENPMPVTAAYNWWGHLIFLSKWLGKMTAKGVNSWGPNWEANGCVALRGSKCLPNEAIAIKAVKPRIGAM